MFYIKGVVMSFTQEKLRECLKIPSRGVNIQSDFTIDWDGYEEKSYYYILGSFTKQEAFNKRKRSSSVILGRHLCSAGSFSVDDTILHYFLVYLLVL